MTKYLEEESVRAHQAISVCHKVMNTFNLNDRSSWHECLKLTNSFLNGNID